MAAFIINKKKLEDYLTSNKKIIGEGFYSRVYSYNLGSVEVAVKTILKKENKNLIWSEAQTYERLGSYEKLLKFYGVCEINDLPALILEYPKNSKPLKNIIKECENDKTFIETEKSLKIIREITDCLKYVHSKGFYHGDLKPSNILVLDYEKAEDLSIRLIDFNLSSLEPEIKKSPSRDYEYEEEEEVSKTHDLFKLGDLIYEILTNKKPKQRLIKEFYEINPSAPKEFDQILKICWDCDNKDYDEEIAARILDNIIELEEKIHRVYIKEKKKEKEQKSGSTYKKYSSGKSNPYKIENIEEPLSDIFLAGYNVYENLKTRNKSDVLAEYLEKSKKIIPKLGELYKALDAKDFKGLLSKNSFEPKFNLLKPEYEQLINLDFSEEKAKCFKIASIVEFPKIEELIELIEANCDKQHEELRLKLDSFRENNDFNYYLNLSEAHIGFVSTHEILKRMIRLLGDSNIEYSFNKEFSGNDFCSAVLFLKFVQSYCLSNIKIINSKKFNPCSAFLEEGDLLYKSIKNKIKHDEELNSAYQLFEPEIESFNYFLEHKKSCGIISEEKERKTYEPVFLILTNLCETT